MRKQSKVYSVKPMCICWPPGAQRKCRQRRIRRQLGSPVTRSEHQRTERPKSILQPTKHCPRGQFKQSVELIRTWGARGINCRRLGKTRGCCRCGRQRSFIAKVGFFLGLSGYRKSYKERKKNHVFGASALGT